MTALHPKSNAAAASTAAPMAASAEAETWLTAREIAERRYPGLPHTERGIQKLAAIAGWASRSRAGRGGGREYPVSALPAAARAAREDREAAKAAQAVTPADTATAPGALPGWRRRRLDARLAILDRIEADALVLGSHRKAQEAFVARARAGLLDDPFPRLLAEATARRGEPGARTISLGTLIRWRRDYEAAGARALAPGAGNPDAASWLPVFLKRWKIPSKPSISAIHEALTSEGVALPSLRHVQRAVAGLGAIERNRGRMGPRALKTLRSHVVRDFGELRIADVYTADGHTFDAEVQNPVSGRPFRPEIVSVIDIASRRAVGWSVGLAESAWVVTDALRVACTGAGVPAIWYTDRGKGFRNAMHDAAETGLLARLGITKEQSLPYNSQARGVGERFHRSCWVRAAKQLPAFMGADMDPEARKIVHLRGRREIAGGGRSRFVMPWDEFLRWAQEQVDAYNARPHRGLPKTTDSDGRRRHLSPDEAWAAALLEHEPARVAEADADLLFRPYFKRQVNRGAVSIGSKTYFSKALEEADLHGRTVAVGVDIHDAARVTVHDLDGRLICAAELDGNAQPYFTKSAVEEAREKRAAGRLRRLEAKAEGVRAELEDADDAAFEDAEEEKIAPLFPRLAPCAPPEPDDEDEDFWSGFSATIDGIRRSIAAGGGSA